MLGHFGSFWLVLGTSVSFWVVLAGVGIFWLSLGLLLGRFASFCVVWLTLDRFRSFLVVLGCFESVSVSFWIVLACFGLFWVLLGQL